MLLRLPRQLLLLVIAALLPLIALSAMLGAGALRQGQADMQDDARDRVAYIAAGLARELQSQVEILQTVADSSLLDGRLDQARFDDVAHRLLAQRPRWIAVVRYDPDGNRLFDLPAAPAGAPHKVIDKVDYARAVATGRPVVGSILRGPRGRAAFMVFAPITREGRVNGVLAAVIQPNDIRDLLVAARLPKGWRAGVLDQADRMVARSIPTPDVATRPANANAVAAMKRAPQGLYRTVALDQVPVVTAFQVLPDTGWSIHVSMPQNLYEAPFVRSVWIVGVGSAASILLAGLFVWLLARELELRHEQQAAREEGLRLEALGRMTGGVAHDFNNLLMIVMGSAELLKRRAGGDRRLEELTDAILVAVQRGQTLTRQLLAFGRRGVHEPIGFLLQDRADDFLTLLSRTVSAEVAVQMRVPAEVWPIFADPNALEVALINLAVNARDAMPDGGALTITAANIVVQKPGDDGVDVTGEHVMICVSDTGFGIPPEQLVHVFEPFYTTKASGKGTGLGLSQVYGFARQSNGAATIRSRPGEGTTVTIYLPRSGQVARRTPPAPAPAPDAEVDNAGHVLLVEDNTAVAEVSQDMLRTAGYEVTWAQNGEAALKRLAEGCAADVVLSDVMIEGGMSGLDFAAQIAGRWPALPVVLMTGYSEAVAGGAAQGYQVLAKPFTQAEVVAAIRRALAGRSKALAERAAP